MRTASRYADPKAQRPHGLFQDALASWTNDDVLQTTAAREALGAKHPAALRVLDWPELRALFARYDPPATRDGRRDRRFGLLSVGLATLGLVLAMASPLAVGGERVIERVAAALVAAGLAMMAFHRFGRRSKALSLAHRFGAERVRALYFQAVVNNLDLAARAMTDDAALGDWTADAAGFGYAGSALIFGLLLALIAGLYFWTKISRVILFWAAFILTRPLGAVVGDFLDKPHDHGGLALSRYSASSVLLLFIAACILFFPQRAAREAH